MLYRLYVNGVYMYCSDSVESIEDFIDTYFTLIEDMLYDQVRDTDVNRALDKLMSGDYKTVTASRKAASACRNWKRSSIVSAVPVRTLEDIF